MKNVIIASKNPVKIEATKMAFKRTFPNQDFKFKGVSVKSGVSDQPKSNQESKEGANNRADNAKELFSSGDYWVGIEAGIEKTKEGMESFSWVVIKSKEREGRAKGNIFFLPKRVAQLIEEGKELGEADDIVFNDNNSKQKNGSVGILTHDLIDRTDYYYVALVLALIPFKNSNLY